MIEIEDEEIQIDRTILTERTVRSKDEWVKIGVDYYAKREKGWTQTRYAKTKNIPISTFQSAIRRYDSDIKTAIKEKSERAIARAKTKAQQQKDVINAFRAQLKDRVKSGTGAAGRKSEKWFKDTIRSRAKSKTVKIPVPGSIYAFAYDAKHKDTLPYWDRYPLIIYLGAVTSPNGTVMLKGLNLHYLPPAVRQSFMENLLVYITTKSITSKTRLKVSWNKVKGFAGAMAMIKNYLPNHILGSMIEIDPTSWAEVIMLPTQDFRSQGSSYSANAVWNDSTSLKRLKTLKRGR